MLSSAVRGLLLPEPVGGLDLSTPHDKARSATVKHAIWGRLRRVHGPLADNGLHARRQDEVAFEATRA